MKQYILTEVLGPASLQDHQELNHQGYCSEVTCQNTNKIKLFIKRSCKNQIKFWLEL